MDRSEKGSEEERVFETLPNNERSGDFRKV